MKRWAAACLALALLAVIAIRFAEPILDSDLFWHMAYAKQMLASHTLIPDHTIYSWTPTSNNAIYCAWASEMFLYWLWEHLGMASLFVLRYLCVLAIMALLWNYARRRALASQPIAWLILIAVLLGSVAGTVLKPEIFSLLIFNVLVWAFFQWKVDGQLRWLYAMPLLMVLWVNAHGAFILAAPFFVATFAGEALNRRLTRPMIVSWALCSLAVLVTPYGWRYPSELIRLLRMPRPDIAWNDAHQSIFASSAASLHFIDLGVLMAAILLLAALRSRHLDWSILLLNLAYVPLFMVYLRTTFFWPAIFGYSVLYLATHPPTPTTKPSNRAATVRKRFSKAANAAAILLFLFLATRATLDAYRNPWYGSWLGFGIGYINPVTESEFLASSNLGPRLYNMFDSGGYLLWRLHPQYQVMTDARSFPYLAWFDDQYQFSLGRSFDDFVRRYPADVAVIDLLHKATWRNFLASPDWRPVFYGPTSAVFAKRNAPFPLQPKAATGDLRNARTAFLVFDFAMAIGDFPTVWSVLNHIETKLARQASTEDLEAARAYREGHRALRAGDWDRARLKFDKAFRNKYVPEREQLIRTFLASIE
ncbi:MAG TPA: hypothetical protein VEU96_32080, partial [Bryobacteraceae bacterium]|nr:hypothetical protein [Bryobacteraceae bacterium]